MMKRREAVGNLVKLVGAVFAGKGIATVLSGCEGMGNNEHAYNGLVDPKNVRSDGQKGGYKYFKTTIYDSVDVAIRIPEADELPKQPFGLDYEGTLNADTDNAQLLYNPK